MSQTILTRPLFRTLAAGCAASFLGALPLLAAPDEWICITYTDNGPPMTGEGSGQYGDMRYCILRSNGSLNPEGSIIKLQSADPQLAKELPPITRTVTITSAYVEFNAYISAGYGSRIFFIDTPPDQVVTIRQIRLTNGYAKGGNGGLSAGGGAGLGGAIFVNSGQLVIDNVELGDFGAEGGRGGNYTQQFGGGGGGLGGNGGGNGGGGGGFRGQGGNGGNNAPAGNAGGGGGGIFGTGGAGFAGQVGQQYAGGGGGGTVNASGQYGQGNGGNGGEGATGGADGGLYGGGGGAGPATPPPDPPRTTRGGTGGKFGGGGGGSSYTGGYGGIGGDFGGGGGANNAGGPGGYGGGGGGGGNAGGSGGGGAGGFGAGNGAGINSGGHGGSAYGGLIFIRGSANAGPVTILNNSLPVGGLNPGIGGTASGSSNTNPGTTGQTGGSTIYTEAIGAEPPPIIFNNSAERVVSGTIGSSSNGNITIRKRGSGRLIFAQPHTYFGYTVIEAGTLQLAPGSNLGTSLASVDGTLDLNGNHLTVRGLASSGGSGAITSTVGGNFTVTLNSNGLTTDFGGALIDPPSGTLSLLKTGTSVQGILGQNPFTGGTTVNGGQLRTGAPNTPFGAIGRGSVTIGGTGEILVLGSNSFMGYDTASLTGRTVRINSGGTLRAASGVSQHLVALVLAGGTLAATDAEPTFGSWNFDRGISTPGGGTTSNITGGNATLSQSGGTVFNIGNGDVVNVSTVLASLNGNPGTGLRKTGPGTLVLNGFNTFTAGTTLDAGKLTLGVGGGVGALRGTLIANAGTTVESSAANGFGFSPGTKLDLVTLNGTTLLNTSSGDLGWGVAYTLNGATLSSNGGTPSATAASKFSFGGPSGNPTSVLAKQDSTSSIAGRIDLRSDNGNTGTVITTETNANLNIGAAITTQNASQLLTKSGPGTLTLSGPNTYAGETVLNAGVLGIGSNTALGASKLRFMGGTLRYVGVNPDISANINLAGTGGFLVDTNSQNVTFATALTGSAGLIKSGAGTLTLSGANGYSGTTSLVGGELGFAHASALGTSRLTFNGGTLKYIGLNPDLSGIFNAGGSGPIKIDTNGQDVTFANALSNSNGLSKAGAGRLTLNTANPDLAGTTTLAGGSLRLTEADRLGTSRITFAGGTLEYAGFNTDLSSLFNQPSTSAYSIDPGTQTVMFVTPLAGSGGFTKAGTGGTLVLAGNNTYSGLTTIQGGVLQIGGGGVNGTLGSTSSIVNNGTLAFSRTGTVALPVPISGTGGLTVQSGVVTTASAHTFSGPILVTGASTLRLNPGASLFNFGHVAGSQLSVSNGGTVIFAENDVFDNNNNVPDTVVVAQSGGLLTNTGTFTTFNHLTLNGAELRAAGGANELLAAYQIKGTVTVGGSTPSLISATGTTNAFTHLNLGAGTTFAVADATGSAAVDLTVDTRLQNPWPSGNGALTKTGVGTMLLTAVNTYAGPTAINAGTLALGASATLGNGGAVTIASGASLDVTALGAAGFTLATSRTLTNNGTINGVLAISGNYAGNGSILGGLTLNSGVTFARSSGSVTVTGTLVNHGTIRFSNGAVFNGGGLTSATNHGVIDLITASPTSTLPLEFTGSGIVLPPGGVAVKTAARVGDTATIQIDGFTTHTYQLQRSTNLASGFVSIGAPQSGTGTTAPVTLTFTDPGAPAGAVFYRVLVQ